METFNYSPAPGLSVPTEPAVRVVKFGDGYEQRQPKGINNNLRKYSPTFRVYRRDGILIDDFFKQHGGVTPFLWTPPLDYKPAKFKCPKWTVTVNSTVMEFSCEFEEVLM